MISPRPHWTGHAIWAIPCLLLLGVWEIVGRADPAVAFFFSFPSQVASDLVAGLVRGGLVRDLVYTLLPAVAGLISAALVGGTLGFALVGNIVLARRLGPLVTFLGAFPVFAIAPMTLVWFGLGLTAKFFLAFLSCVFLFLQAAYRGGLAVPRSLTTHFAAHGFSSLDEFRKLRLPFAMDWLLAAFKTASNLALLGVFIGEFIASEHGLARVMLDAGSLYNVKRVLSAAVLFALAAMAMTAIADLATSMRVPLLRWISVPGQIRFRKD